MKKTILAFKVASFVYLFLCAIGNAQQIIPLDLETVPDGSASYMQRLFIYVGIDGGPANKYLFDTGSDGFNAAFYDPTQDGPYTGSLPNPAVWSNTGTVSTGANYSYSDGTTYNLNEVTVSSVQIYSPTNLTTAWINLIPPSSSTGFQVGQVLSKSSGGVTDPTFSAALSTGTAPINNGSYGTFGAGEFAGLNTSGSTPFTNGSIFGQSTTTGWVVSANGSNAYAILGLNNSIRSQFSSTNQWAGTGQQMPISGANSTTEFGGGIFNYTLSGGSNFPVSWSSGTLLDTGTENNNLHYTNQTALNPYETTNAPQVDQGYTITTSGTNANSSAYSFVTTATNDPVTYNANVKTNGSNSTFGISFFLNNSVGFDLENQQTLYTANVVTAVPEPSTYALFGLGMLALVIAYRRKVV